LVAGTQIVEGADIMLAHVPHPGPHAVATAPAKDAKGAVHHTAPVRKPRVNPFHDGKSIAIVSSIALAAALLTAIVWYFAKPLAIEPTAFTTEQRTPGNGVQDLSKKVIHTYWKESYGVFHHYYTDPATGRMIDGGTVTVEDLLRQGIEVPGYEVVHPKTAPVDALAARFKAIQDELRK
jgi:hypothetical protein